MASAAAARTALRPSLLDRLIAPPRAAAGAAFEAGGAGAVLEPIGVRELCSALTRDLEWLLNSRRWLPQGAAELPHSAHSILGYGLPDLSGYSWRSPGDAQAIAEALRQAIASFEPRLRAHSVQVSALPRADAADFTLRFRIDAVLHVEPLELPVRFDTDVDLDARRIALRGPL